MFWILCFTISSRVELNKAAKQGLTQADRGIDEQLLDRGNDKTFIKQCKNLQTYRHLQHLIFYKKKCQPVPMIKQWLKTSKYAHIFKQTHTQTFHMNTFQVKVILFLILISTSSLLQFDTLCSHLSHTNCCSGHLIT